MLSFYRMVEGRNQKSAIEIDSSIWREEIGKSTLQFGGKKSAIEIDSSNWREEIGSSIWREEIGKQHLILLNNFFASLSLSLSIYLCHALSELRVEEKSIDSSSESVCFR